MIIGYTTGTFDLFHKGHVEFLKKTKNYCDHLIVGVTTDELGFKEKGRKPIINTENRIAVVNACKYVDQTLPHNDQHGDKIKPFQLLHFQLVFIGDDYINDTQYTQLHTKIPVKVIFLPYTKEISTTSIRNKIINTSKDIS
jgi:glycerol-3-phosphate cytidylyltransferase